MRATPSDTPPTPLLSDSAALPTPRKDSLLRVPVATYRVQLTPQFTLTQLNEVVDYIDRLGITDVYCSPIFAARRGSTHGYDLSSHTALNPELGTRADFDRLSDSLRHRQMGLVLDIVPNHMGIDTSTNVWWRDVLENGSSSPFAHYFDIDWNPVKTELRDKVLLPILGDQYGVVLERGELQIEFDAGALALRYFDRRLPINPRQSPMVLGYKIDELSARLGVKHGDVRELRSILSSLRNLPPMTSCSGEEMIDRQREKEVARERLAKLVQRAPEVAQHIAAAIRVFNGQPGDAASFDLLHGLLEVQAYRLAYWRTAVDEINYRRFFDVNDLAGLRMEDPRVFADTHPLVLDLIASGSVTGIRIDHPDGLFDPAGYFESLQAAIRDRVGSGARRLYVAVEKILGRGERLREDWLVDGTTGYASANSINGLFVHAEGLSDLRRVYRRFAVFRALPSDTIYTSKKFMMRTAMASELNVLVRALNRLSEGDRRSRDFTLNGLRRALIEVIACFPVYRTYVTARGATADDESVVDSAIAEAKRRNPVQEPSIFAFIRRMLLPAPVGPGDAADPERDRSVAFACKFQQYTAPVIAKGLEDTAFYRDVLLLSANEVGGDLRHRTRSTTEFHAENWHRLSTWPYEMTAVSTHDSKRGEDARARLNVLTERVEDWRSEIGRWASINDSARMSLQGRPAPDRNDEWMFYQALIGAWPAEDLNAPLPTAAPDSFVSRMQAFMLKAIKEAKRHTSWLHANAEYEEAVARFVHSTLAGDRAEAFLAAFVPFQRRIAWFGMLGSLSQHVLRLASPGVPDTYQGAELWNFALVDPDNRQPVDFAHHRRLFDSIEPAIVSVERAREQGDEPAALVQETLNQLFDHWTDGRVKLFTIALGLRLRRAYPDLFLHGEYQPLGSDLDDPHLIAFSRRLGEREVIVMAPRYFATLLRGAPRRPFGMERWRTTSVRLPARLGNARFVNVFTGERLAPVVYRDVPWVLAGSAFQSWPVAMLWVES